MISLFVAMNMYFIKLYCVIQFSLMIYCGGYCVNISFDGLGIFMF